MADAAQRLQDEANRLALCNVIEVADRVCKKLEHPTASVTIIDQTDLRTAIEAARAIGRG